VRFSREQLVRTPLGWRAFMKDLLQTFPDQNQKTTTFATLLKRMIDKDFVAYTEFGNSENTIHW
jgi:hypothetical protein